jgi:hypothetical protein
MTLKNLLGSHFAVSLPVNLPALAHASKSRIRGPLVADIHSAIIIIPKSIQVNPFDLQFSIFNP